MHHLVAAARAVRAETIGSERWHELVAALAPAQRYPALLASCEEVLAALKAERESLTVPGLESRLDLILKGE